RHTRFSRDWSSDVCSSDLIPVDEMGLIASLRDQPLPVVKCITNDLLVPADAEYVLEGYLHEAGHVEPEGPYGEFLGYYGGVKLRSEERRGGEGCGARWAGY